MMKKKIGWLIISNVIMLLYMQTAYSQERGNYTIEWDVFDSGGGFTESSTDLLNQSIGQFAGIGASVSNEYTESAGFYAVLEEAIPISVTPTPLPTEPPNPTPIETPIIPDDLDQEPTSPTPVPEPTTLLLLSSGLLGGIVLFKKKIRRML
ncbi:hypothetical protein U14_00070 [Candidatus Moduliflexus flocculans]|uniref:Ice-binding protein C-terminal domain-containing protein n=1 Tax=Candidatus Moduliflexus flocculans TaxID=1499966 RepID=A0A0S6VPD2_9BACT|nr:hypothetical protein U14_00070 [Candidatus Moduliflexus flocculans]